MKGCGMKDNEGKIHIDYNRTMRERYDWRGGLREGFRKKCGIFFPHTTGKIPHFYVCSLNPSLSCLTDCVSQ